MNYVPLSLKFLISYSLIIYLSLHEVTYLWGPSPFLQFAGKGTLAGGWMPLAGFGPGICELHRTPASSECRQVSEVAAWKLQEHWLMLVSSPLQATSSMNIEPEPCPNRAAWKGMPPLQQTRVIKQTAVNFRERFNVNSYSSSLIDRKHVLI